MSGCLRQSEGLLSSFSYSCCSDFSRPFKLAVDASDFGFDIVQLL